MTTTATPRSRKLATMLFNQWWDTVHLTVCRWDGSPVRIICNEYLQSHNPKYTLYTNTVNPCILFFLGSSGSYRPKCHCLSVSQSITHRPALYCSSPALTYLIPLILMIRWVSAGLEQKGTSPWVVKHCSLWHKTLSFVGPVRWGWGCAKEAKEKPEENDSYNIHDKGKDGGASLYQQLYNVVG